MNKADEENQNGMDANNNDERKPINMLNILNVIAFVFNIAITYGIGVAGIWGLPNNSDLSEKYQTIVTPVGWAFSIWAIIFIFEAIFTIAQCLPKFRATPMVQSGVSFWYILTCLFQIGWTFAFSFEIIVASLVCMLLIGVSLVCLLISQYYLKSEGTLVEYWLLKFPFQVHCGWIIAASAVNTNVLIVSLGESMSLQLTVAILSLAVLHAIALWTLFVPDRPNYTIPAVLAWANGGIYAELGNPKDSITDMFGSDIISAIRNAAATVSILILVLIVVRVVMAVVKKYTNRGVPPVGVDDGHLLQ